MPTTQTTATAKAPKQFPAPEPKLSGPAFKPAEYRRTAYFATPAVGITLDHLMKPIYWSHVAGKLRPLDRIEAVPEDGAWWADLLVLRVVGNGAYVKVLSTVSLDETTAEDMDGDAHFVKYQSPATRWCVFRKADGERVASGFESKGLAVEHMIANFGARKAA